MDEKAGRKQERCQAKSSQKESRVPGHLAPGPAQQSCYSLPDGCGDVNRVVVDGKEAASPEEPGAERK